VYSILLCEAPSAYAVLLLLYGKDGTLRVRACQRWMIFLYFTSRASARKNAPGIILLLLPVRLFMKTDVEFFLVSVRAMLSAEAKL